MSTPNKMKALPNTKAIAFMAPSTSSTPFLIRSTPATHALPSHGWSRALQPLKTAVLRPWIGHDGLFHARVRYGEGSSDYARQAAPESNTAIGDGSKELMPNRRERFKYKPQKQQRSAVGSEPLASSPATTTPPMSARCLKVLQAVGTESAQSLRNHFVNVNLNPN